MRLVTTSHGHGPVTGGAATRSRRGPAGEGTSAEVGGRHPRRTVEGAFDLGRLDVELVEVDEALPSTVLSDAGLGQVQQGSGWLEVEALRAAVVSASGADRASDFDGMVQYAAAHGWVSADGRRVRVHCVPRASSLSLSREAARHARLLRTVGAYRLVMGQPRQEDLLRYVGEDAAALGLATHRLDARTSRS